MDDDLESRVLDALVRFHDQVMRPRLVGKRATRAEYVEAARRHVRETALALGYPDPGIEEEHP